MSDEVRRRCLDPSYTVKEGRARFSLAKIGGTVERYGGSIAIESARGRGSKFILTFPSAGPADGAPLLPVEQSGPSLRILIVDDQPIFCDILAETLAEEGHFVERANHGKAALESFERLECDLVITDKAMPLMNGDQLAAAIKARSPDTPIIMLTGFSDVEGSPDQLSEFIDLALTKPVSHRKLCEAIRAVTSH
jgi:CheY-like chemotaxis protein